MYVLVTAELPIPAQFRAHAPLTSPQEHNPHISDKINQAIIKGMAFKPEDRPQTMTEWLNLLAFVSVREENQTQKPEEARTIQQQDIVSEIPPTDVPLKNHSIPQAL